MPILSSLPLKPFPVINNDAIYVGGYESIDPNTGNGIVQKFNAAGTSQFINIYNDTVESVAVDTNGDYLVATRTNNDTIFLRKYDSTNTLQWSKSNSNINGLHCHFDYYGRIYLTYFDTSTNLYGLVRYSSDGTSELNFTNNLAGFSVLAVDKYYNIYIGGDTRLRKYSDNGTLLFTLSFGTDFDDTINAIAVDIDDNFYLGTGSAGTNDIFKFDSNGNLIWELSAGIVDGIAVDKDSNVYVTGDLAGDVTTRKYDSTGTLIWSTPTAPDVWDEGTDIKVDNIGNVYITQGTGETGVQLRKLNGATGALIWERKLNTTGVWGARHLDVQYKSLEI